ncbi:MAG: LptA/OstA family protein [Acidobacteriota bacterium]
MGRLRLLRWTLLVVLSGFAVWVIADIWRTAGPSPPPLAPPPVPAAPEAFPVAGPVDSASEGFRITQERGGEIVLQLSAEKMLGMEQGSRILSDIVIEMRPDPGKDPDRLVRIEGAAGRFDAAEHEVRLQGEIHLALDTGEWLETDGLRYRLDQRLAAAAGPVRFDFSGTRGQATGMVANLAIGRIDLVSDVILAAPDAGQGSATIRAESLRRTPESIALDGAVRIEGQWGAFSGRDIVFVTSPDGQTVGESTADGTLSSSLSDTDTKGRLMGGAWHFELDGDRALRAVIASAGPRMRLEDDPEASVHLSDIFAPTIRIEFPDRAAGGQSRLVAQGNAHTAVRAVFARGPVAEVTSADLVVRRGSGERVAVFSGGVQAGGELRQASGLALDVRESHAAVLTGAGAEPARLIQDGQVLSADRIRFDPDGSGEATGHVELSVPRQEEAGGFAGTSEAAVFAPDGRRVRLMHDVRVWQDERTLSAGWIENDRGAGTLRAGDDVHLSFRPGDGIAALRATERIQARSDTVVWENSPRRVTFDGSVRLTQEGARVEADHIVLAQAESGERTLLATGHVDFEDPQWHGDGDRLLYRIDSGEYELESESALARVAAASDTGFLTGRLLRFDRSGGQVEVASRDGGRVTVRYDGTEPVNP